MPHDTKDYILNLRVSRETYEKVKQKASENRETISNLVRKVIEDGMDIVSDLSEEMFGMKRNATPGSARIVSYHSAVAGERITCHECGTAIKKGHKMTIGETATLKKYYFCPSCR